MKPQNINHSSLTLHKGDTGHDEYMKLEKIVSKRETCSTNHDLNWVHSRSISNMKCRTSCQMQSVEGKLFSSFIRPISRQLSVFFFFFTSLRLLFPL